MDFAAPRVRRSEAYPVFAVTCKRKVISQKKNRTSCTTFRDRYNAAKTSLRAMQVSKAVDDAALAALDGLFACEQDIGAAHSACDRLPN